MCLTSTNYSVAPDLVDAARELIRSQDDRCIVGITQLLEELSDTFGDRFRVSPDMYRLLDLIGTLWADPHIDQVPATGLKAMLPRDSHIQSAAKEGSKS